MQSSEKTKTKTKKITNPNSDIDLQFVTVHEGELVSIYQRVQRYNSTQLYMFSYTFITQTLKLVSIYQRVQRYQQHSVLHVLVLLYGTDTHIFTAKPDFFYTDLIVKLC